MSFSGILFFCKFIVNVRRHIRPGLRNRFVNIVQRNEDELVETNDCYDG